ncbi:MAG: hypothetical protein EZS28_019052 [Streblomastix strix]|uniref:Uncharacterized protein n=1 Tax=Streblomastix strix TaxID=222440 RepID=A0A5J4VSL7_9EUKA|nr:MAG: hypothetical protein EZS28_019052 [Streblomastix strix]
MLKNPEEPKFFSQAAYLSHTMNSIPTGIPNLDQLEAIHRSIDWDFDPAHLDTAMDDARKKLQQQLASVIDKVADESLRVTAEAVNTSIIKHRKFTWNISYVEITLPEDTYQVEKTLINAQTKANIALAMEIAATHQQLDGRAESERIEAWLASIAEIGNGIEAARRANLYDFKADQEGTHNLTEASFDATNRLKSVHSLKPLYSQAKKALKPSISDDKTIKKEKPENEKEKDTKEKKRQPKILQERHSQIKQSWLFLNWSFIQSPFLTPSSPLTYQEGN